MMTLPVAVNGLRRLRTALLFSISSVMIFLSGCSRQYQITDSITTGHTGPGYASYLVMEPSTGTADDKTLLAITCRLEKAFTEIGLKSDSLKPQLLVLVRGETHQLARHSAGSKRGVPKTYSITNPVYSAFENTSDQLKGNPSSDGSRNETEFFFRVHAIDAVKNELIWSVKVYPRSRDGITGKGMTRLMEDLMHSLKAVLNHDNTKN